MYNFDIENFDAFYTSSDKTIEKLITLNHPRLSTKISYNLGDITKGIDQLSLGQKGTILLKLFLSSGDKLVLSLLISPRTILIILLFIQI